METVNFEDFKREGLKRKAKGAIDGVKKKVNQFVDWAMLHPGEAIAILTLGAGVLKKGCGTIESVAENRRRDLDFYDPRTGRHTIAKRRPSARESVEIDRRYRAGESYEEILWTMRLHR